MKSFFATILFGSLIVLTGCNQCTGRSDAATSPSVKPMAGQAEGTFSLAVPSTKLNQGETTTVSVGINRGKNFGQEVSLKLGELPKGVSLVPANPVIKGSDMDTKMTLKVADDANLGDFTVKITGHPAKGADAVGELRMSVAAQEISAANATAEATKAKWQEYTISVEKQLDQFAAKYTELKERADKAEGQAKKDLERKLAEAKTKLDAATIEFNELKSAGADRWEKVKDGVGNAIEDLKKAFE